MDPDIAGAPQELARMTEKITARIAAEPSYRSSLHRLLAFCIAPRSESDVHEEVLTFPEMKTAFHSPGVLLGWLVEAGGIEQLASGGGKPKWKTTDAGRKAVEQHGPGRRLVQLLAQEQVYLDVYRQVLQFCTRPRTRGEIETLLQDEPTLNDLKVYPSYIVERLEAAGGLEWDGKWRTTEAGTVVIA